uniref:Ig-like domain-containing protein n=1 Tax=Macrostomum lignano TaxID=282301 RepID=A0A1I8G450_9PLAT
ITKVPQLVRLGDNATLECSTWLERQGPRQDQDLDLDWVKLGSWPGASRTRPTKRWSNSPAVSGEGGYGGQQSVRSQMTAMLTIPDVRLSDAGLYECRRSFIGRPGFAPSQDNVARVTLTVRLSRSQHKYFMSTTTPAARPTPVAGSPGGANGWWQRSRGASYEKGRVLND